ncbi:MAG: acetyl-CoA carboxylase biotin carboxylase subunit [Chloroflexi bacterium]|nr:acetyl-CoA carboxylase biotin carboxylase subunit [Chloroflexota bacterium]MBU1751549.1 acetyl-CoA carboxylase biotin carboxylase subunit [Chloroflexota bacterium]
MIKINKVLVANRGEIAVRVLRTCRELGTETVAVFSEADREAPHVHYADEAYCIGRPPARESYLRGNRIIQIAVEAGVEAIHPGHDFLAESPDFARACAEAGLIWVGPRPETMHTLRDRFAVRRLARELGLPVLPGTDHALDDAGLLVAADEMGYPLLIKAAVGNGDTTARPVGSRAELEAALPVARREAKVTSGDDALYLERLVERAHHIEVQLLGDSHGHVIHLGERKRAIQRQQQRLITETPAWALKPAVRSQLCQSAVRFAQSVGYVGAGTVEFLLDPAGNYYFLKAYPHLQVAHTVTELVTGIDIVKEQLRIAAGRELRYAQQDVQPRGWALECAILAEDPVQDYAPGVGRISRLREPGGPGVRVDSGICEGQTITADYDPLLAKLASWGESRGVAIVRMRRALDEYQILGVPTNLDLHRAILQSSRFCGGLFDSRFLEDQPVSVEWEEEDEVLTAALAAALQDWRRRGGDRVKGNGASPWKMLGRWDLHGGGTR